MTDNAESAPLRADISPKEGTSLKNRKTCLTFKRFLIKHVFIILTTIGVIVGFGLGFGIRIFKPTPATIRWLGVPGDIFIRLLKLTILPIIAGNVIIVASKLNPRTNGKVSLVSFGFILAANIISPTLGVTFSSLIRPGVSSRNNASQVTQKGNNLNKISTSDVIYDLTMNMFPDNIVGVSIFQTQTMYQTEMDTAIQTLLTAMNATNTQNLTAEEIHSQQSLLMQELRLVERRKSGRSYSVNMIGVLFIACAFGIAARYAGEKGKPFIAFFESMTEIVCIIIRAFIWLTPIGACFMIATSIAEVDNILDTFSRLGLFIVTVLCALLCHFLLGALAYFIVSRRNPFAILKPSFRSWFISFATTAPVVAVPEMYEACDKFGISTRVSRFVIPFAASLKGDGSAVFVCASVVFVAQLSDVPIHMGTAFIIIFQSATAALALPNIPSAAIVIIVTILNSIGVPVKPVALLFALEWILDRIRSGNMALTHMYCAAFTNALCKDAIIQDDEEGDGMEMYAQKEPNGSEESDLSNEKRGQGIGQKQNSLTFGNKDERIDF